MISYCAFLRTWFREPRWLNQLFLLVKCDIGSWFSNDVPFLVSLACSLVFNTRQEYFKQIIIEYLVSKEIKSYLIQLFWNVNRAKGQSAIETFCSRRKYIAVEQSCISLWGLRIKIVSRNEIAEDLASFDYDLCNLNQSKSNEHKSEDSLQLTRSCFYLTFISLIFISIGMIKNCKRSVWTFYFLQYVL